MSGIVVRFAGSIELDIHGKCTVMVLELDWCSIGIGLALYWDYFGMLLAGLGRGSRIGFAAKVGAGQNGISSLDRRCSGRIPAEQRRVGVPFLWRAPKNIEL